MTPQFTADKAAKLQGLDPDRPAPRPRRALTTRVMTVIMAANHLALAHGRRTITAAQVRATLTAAGELTNDQDSQWLGDTLGSHGIDLPKAKVKGVTVYTLPAGGIDRDLIEARYIVPADWDWTPYGQDDEQDEEDDQDDQDDQDEEQDEQEED